MQYFETTQELVLTLLFAGSFLINLLMLFIYQDLKKFNRLLQANATRYAGKKRSSGLYIVKSSAQLKEHKLTTKRSKR